uniref:Uncharacterized protein n=1 Tax=Equus asinus TaxID=9793 RepID=A0A9L0IE66_EQUAS
MCACILTKTLSGKELVGNALLSLNSVLEAFADGGHRTDIPLEGEGRGRGKLYLVRRVAGLRDEADPDFQLALHFVLSNFRFHHFLDVNSHKVEKTIEGIYEKFIIHSDLSKAASWKRLTEEFLNASLPSIKEIKTDAHYSILSLLLCLSDSPSNSNYVETPRDKEVEKKDDFDWGKYLMEGEEIDLGPNADTPNWSEESEGEDDQQPLSREDSGIQVDRTPIAGTCSNVFAIYVLTNAEFL